MLDLRHQEALRIFAGLPPHLSSGVLEALRRGAVPVGLGVPVEFAVVDEVLLGEEFAEHGDQVLVIRLGVEAQFFDVVDVPSKLNRQTLANLQGVGLTLDFAHESDLLLVIARIYVLPHKVTLSPLLL